MHWTVEEKPCVYIHSILIGSLLKAHYVHVGIGNFSVGCEHSKEAVYDLTVRRQFTPLTHNDSTRQIWGRNKERTGWIRKEKLEENHSSSWVDSIRDVSHSQKRKKLTMQIGSELSSIFDFWFTLNRLIISDFYLALLSSQCHNFSEKF